MVQGPFKVKNSSNGSYLGSHRVAGGYFRAESRKHTGWIEGQSSTQL